MIYQWREGARFSIDAQDAGEELERIRVFNNGRLDPRTVIEAAKPEGHTLHSAFEWEDDVAAENYRTWQARSLIGSIQALVQDNVKNEARTIRAFVSVQRENDRSYTSAIHALTDEDLRLQVLEKAWTELEAWRTRHAELTELGRVFSAIDQARSPSE